MATQLGFEVEDLDRLVASFSGGWQMRIGLGKALLQVRTGLRGGLSGRHACEKSCDCLTPFYHSLVAGAGCLAPGRAHKPPGRGGHRLARKCGAGEVAFEWDMTGRKRRCLRKWPALCSNQHHIRAPTRRSSTKPGGTHGDCVARPRVPGPPLYKNRRD